DLPYAELLPGRLHRNGAGRLAHLVDLRLGTQLDREACWGRVHDLPFDFAAVVHDVGHERAGVDGKSVGMRSLRFARAAHHRQILRRILEPAAINHVARSGGGGTLRDGGLLVDLLSLLAVESHSYRCQARW